MTTRCKQGWGGEGVGAQRWGLHQLGKVPPEKTRSKLRPGGDGEFARQGEGRKCSGGRRHVGKGPPVRKWRMTVVRVAWEERSPLHSPCPALATLHRLCV